MNLINSWAEMEVSSVAYEDESTLVKDILSFHPQVVILQRLGSLQPERLFHLLDTIPGRVNLRLIVTQPGNNFIEIYHKEYFAPLNKEDFVTLVQGGHSTGS